MWEFIWLLAEFSQGGSFHNREEGSKMAKQVVLTKKHKQALVELLFDRDADIPLQVRQELSAGGYLDNHHVLTAKGREEASYWAKKAAEAQGEEKQVARSGVRSVR